MLRPHCKSARACSQRLHARGLRPRRRITQPPNAAVAHRHGHRRLHRHGSPRWARTEILRQAGHQFEEQTPPRTFQAIFQANLAKPPVAPPSPWPTCATSATSSTHHPSTPCLKRHPHSCFSSSFRHQPRTRLVRAAGAVVQTLIASFNDSSTQPQLLEANRSHIASQQYADTSLRNAESFTPWACSKPPPCLARKTAPLPGLQAQASQTQVPTRPPASSGNRSSPPDCWASPAGHSCTTSSTGRGHDDHRLHLRWPRPPAPLIQIVSNWQPYINTRAAVASRSTPAPIPGRPAGHGSAQPQRPPAG